MEQSSEPKRRRVSSCGRQVGLKWAACKASENPISTAVTVLAAATLASIGVYVYNESAPSRRAVIVVYGLGCAQKPDVVDDSMSTIKHAVNKKSGDVVVESVCNKSLLSPVVTVITTRIGFKARAVSSIVQQVRDMVQRHIDDNRHVTLIGHSYGGSVVVRVAAMQDMQQSDAVTFVTFGSIIFPPKDSPIRILNVMKNHDVVLRRKALPDEKFTSDTLYDTSMKMLWIRTHKGMNPWDIHNSYLGDMAIVAAMDVPTLSSPESIARELTRVRAIRR